MFELVALLIASAWWTAAGATLFVERCRYLIALGDGQAARESAFLARHGRAVVLPAASAASDSQHAPRMGVVHG